MRSVSKGLWMMSVALVLLTSSCTLLSRSPFSQREVRLRSVQVPEVIHQDKPYDVLVTFDSDDKVQFMRACFRWISEKASVPSPSLYCYAYEVQTDQPIGSACSRWLAEGEFAQTSPLFCSTIQEVRYDDVPSSLTVKIQSRHVELYYNKLECYVEYLEDGQIKQTNKVRAPITVEK